MGPWPFMNQHLPIAIMRTLSGDVTRTQGSSPSVGLPAPPRGGAAGAPRPGVRLEARRLGAGGRHVRHGSRDRGARPAAGCRGGHPRVARRSARHLRRPASGVRGPPSSAWPAGSPATRTTSRRESIRSAQRRADRRAGRALGHARPGTWRPARRGSCRCDAALLDGHGRHARGLPSRIPAARIPSRVTRSGLCGILDRRVHAERDDQRIRAERPGVLRTAPRRP